jgi:predicted amidohydrolase YtcJ
MLLREGGSGAVSGQEQRIGVQQALRTYTTSGAWQDHADRWKGSLEPGMAADLCVLDGALLDERGRLAVDAHAISDMSVAMTLVDGSVVYDGSARAPATAAQNASWARDPNPEHMCANC